MALELIFIGYDDVQTRWYFAEFIRINRDQILKYHTGSYGWILMKDGTIIHQMPPNQMFLYGRHFDQVIVACDRRGTGAWPWHRRELLSEMERQRSRYLVDDEYAFIYYDLDSEEESV